MSLPIHEPDLHGIIVRYLREETADDFQSILDECRRYKPSVSEEEVRKIVEDLEKAWDFWKTLGF